MLPEHFRRGDIYLVRFEGGSSEPDGQRPAIIATNNVANGICDSILVIPLTTETTRMLSFQLLLENQRSGLRDDSKVQTELLTCVGRWRIGRKIGHVPEDLMTEIDHLVIEHLGLKKYTE